MLCNMESESVGKFIHSILIIRSVSLVDCYHRHRMLLGVAEGASEVLPEKALPFEFNLDYMNGGTNYSMQVCVHACTCESTSTVMWLF